MALKSEHWDPMRTQEPPDWWSRQGTEACPSLTNLTTCKVSTGPLSVYRDSLSVACVAGLSPSCRDGYLLTWTLFNTQGTSRDPG